MAKKYYAWKDPACGGVDIEWTELTGAEFYHMLKKEENRGRRFIRLGNDICPDDNTVIIPCFLSPLGWDHLHCQPGRMGLPGQGTPGVVPGALSISGALHSGTPPRAGGDFLLPYLPGRGQVPYYRLAAA